MKHQEKGWWWDLCRTSVIWTETLSRESVVRKKPILVHNEDWNVGTKFLSEGQVGQQGGVLGEKSHSISLELVPWHQPNMRNWKWGVVPTQTEGRMRSYMHRLIGRYNYLFHCMAQGNSVTSEALWYPFTQGMGSCCAVCYSGVQMLKTWLNPVSLLIPQGNT